MTEKNKYGDEEKRLLAEAIDSGNLFYVNGEKTKAFREAVQEHYDVPHCVAASSGTAAIHAAVAALEIPPGREVVTSPITDMGTLIGALYQNLIPVFADVDPHTYNVTAESIEAVLTERTGAIVVVHLAGNPAEMDEIVDLASSRGIPVIEDCAQAHGAQYRGRKVGTVGDIGCFSLNAFKHISTGDGGFTVTSDENLYEKMTNYVDKYYDRLGRGVKLQHLAPCYRITELQSAVGIAQLGKVDSVTSRRHELGEAFNRGIAGLEGISTHLVHPHNYCSYWFTMVRVDEGVLGYPRDHVANVMRFEGVPASGGYIPRPLYLEPMFREKAFFPDGAWPAEQVSGRKVEYREGLCPVAEQILADAVKVAIDEFQTGADVERMVAGVRSVHQAALDGEL
ncbi:MAG: DegT/DnrJ/EryC1/StrS family aminotransferase [Promethearchaeota archaeon]